MEKMLENIKGLIPVIAVIMAIAGFYYTTQHRLEHIERDRMHAVQALKF